MKALLLIILYRNRKGDKLPKFFPKLEDFSFTASFTIIDDDEMHGIREVNELTKEQSEQRLQQALDQYEKLIFSLCYRMTNHYFDAQDLTQETFLAYYQSLDTFDGVHEKAYLAKIATNKCLDYLKRADRRMVPAEDTVITTNMPAAPPPEKQVLEDMVQEELRGLCGSLSPPYDQVAELHFCRGMTAKQIAQKTGSKLKTIQTQIGRAKKQLQKRYRDTAVPYQKGGSA